MYLIFSFMALPDYGVDQYDIGSGFGHFGIAVDDVSFFIRCYISVKEIYVEQNRIFSTLFSLPFQFSYIKHAILHIY